MSTKLKDWFLYNFNNKTCYNFFIELFRASLRNFSLHFYGQSARILNFFDCLKHITFYVKTRVFITKKTRLIPQYMCAKPTVYRGFYLVLLGFSFSVILFLYCAGVHLYTFLHWVINDFTFAKPFLRAAADTEVLFSSISRIAFSSLRFAKYSEKLICVTFLKYFEKYDGERLTTDAISSSVISRL